MVERWGHAAALLIGQLLFEIDAASSLAELSSFPHIKLMALDSDGLTTVRVALTALGTCILLTASDASNSPSCSSEVPWEELTSVVIERIQEDSQQRSIHGE